MTTEEKAQRYDEAIERAEGVIEQNPLMEYLKKGIEYIFPELIESEDERIRKALMQNLQERFGTKGNMGKGLDMPDVLAWLEKQCEQKPQRIVSAEAKEAMYDKPAWSEEDEEILKDIITDVKFEGYNNDMQANSYKKINWLKSLRPQNTWRPSDEQIKVLEFFIPYVTKCSIVLEKSKGTLLSLLSDLKKLKG
jgi:hypothetical protein